MTVPNSKRPSGDYDVVSHKAPSNFNGKTESSTPVIKEQKTSFEYKVPKGYEHFINKKNIKEEEIKGDHVEELETRLNNTGERSWEGIDKIMKAIAKKHNISPKKLHDDFKEKNNQIPDEWVKRNDTPVVEDVRSPMERLADSIASSAPKQELKESLFVDDTRISQLEKAVTGLRTVISNNTGSGEVNLEGLDDVSIRGEERVEGTSLVWSEEYQKWVPGAPIPDMVDLTNNDLGDLGDVDTTGAVTGSALLYNAPSDSWYVGIAGGPAGPQGDPGQKGDTGDTGATGATGAGFTGASYDPATGTVTFTSDDGLGFSTGDLRGIDGQDGLDGPEGATGDGFTGGSYNSGTGVVTFTSNDGLGFSTGDLRGADGVDGIDGTPGATGATGAGFTGGAYNAGTGVVEFTSDDGLGFSTGDLRGATGPQGIQGIQGEEGPVGPQGPIGQGTPTGGSTGQILSKVDGTDYNFEWVNLPSDAEIKVAYENNFNTNAFTDGEQSKLAGIAVGAEVNVKSDWNALTGDAQILNKPTIPTTTSELANDSGFLTSTTLGEGMQDFIGDMITDNVETGISVTYDDINGKLDFSVAPQTEENFTTVYRTKLDGIEAGATADQTGAEIKALYEGELDTNAFTDAEQTKLAGIEAGATADQTGAEIKSLYEGEADTNAFTDAEKTKLAGIADGAEVNVQSDWTAVSGDAQILNKPTLGTAAATDSTDYATAAQGATADTAVQPGDLATVATSGSYNDLSDKPTIPAAAPVDSVNGQTGIVVLDTDSVAEGTSNLYSQWSDVTGGIDYTGDVTITDTTEDSLAGPEFSLKRNSASPSDGDYLGQIRFDGKNDNGGDQLYAKITGKTSDVSLGTENGLIETAVVKDGTQTIVARQTGDALKLINGTGLEVDGNITVNGTVDGRDVAADGVVLDSAVQPGDNISTLTNDAGYITSTLTNEQVEDIVGAMVSANVESGIVVTYDDTNGKLDFSVDFSALPDLP